MLKKISLIILGCLWLSYGVYVLLGTPPFPAPPPGSVQSAEPADTESPYRRAYFTNLPRTEVMEFYTNHLPGIISYRLNYPPEDVAELVRKYTLSSYLEEVVHPLKESIFINGFVPTSPAEQINIDKVHYLNKLTARYVPSHVVTRLTVWLLVGWVSWGLLKEYFYV